MSCAAESARERARRYVLMACEQWPTDVLRAELRRAYEPSVIPPCPVCGAKLEIQQIGGEKPTVWACVDGGMKRPDHWKHYERSRFEDRRQGGDARVIELLRRFDALARADGVGRPLPVIGGVGVRDPDARCESFDGAMYRGAGDCSSDGHYLCVECSRLSPDAPRFKSREGRADRLRLFWRRPR